MSGSYSAYHGGSWNLRDSSHARDCAKYWPFGGLNSEFGRLKEVLLYTPPRKPDRIPDPEKAQHLRPVDWKKLEREISALARIYEKHGVTVRRLEGDWFPAAKPNLLFIRDHFLVTPWGAILGRMASPVRAGEEKWAQKALADAGIPILTMIRGHGTFEGADALWLSPRSLLLGLGNRTNRAAYMQIKKPMAEFGVSVSAVKLPKKVQHLLGLLQIVDANLALVRTEIADRNLLKILSGHRFKTIPVAETTETTEGQGMNIVTLAPRRIIMTENCPALKKLYESNGIEVCAEIAFEQGLNAAGGIACATGILSRSLRPK